MKCSLRIFAIIAFSAVVSGCVSIDSAGHSDRMSAVERENDPTILAGWVAGARYPDVREATFIRIDDRFQSVLRELVVNPDVNAELRYKALGRVNDGEELLAIVAKKDLESELRTEALRIISRKAPDAIREKAIFASDGLDERIRAAVVTAMSDGNLLSGIALDGACSAVLRKTAIDKVTSEATLCAFCSDKSVPQKDRDEAALRLFNPVYCEKSILEAPLSDYTLPELAGRLDGDETRIRVLSRLSKRREDKVSTSFSRAVAVLFDGVSARDSVLNFLLDDTIPYHFRLAAAKSLEKDLNLLAEAFRKAGDVTGMKLAVERLPAKFVNSKADQELLLRWFKTVEAGANVESDKILSILAERMQDEESLWHVAVESKVATLSSKTMCMGRITDPVRLVSAASDPDCPRDVREAAIKRLEDSDDIRKVFLSSPDKIGRMISFRRLDANDIKSPEIRDLIVPLFVSLGENGEELDCSAKILQWLDPESNVDSWDVQMKIARTLASSDTPENRRAARSLLVDPNSIENLAVELLGHNSSLALWAVDLIIGDADLVKIVDRARDRDVKCAAVSRIADETELSHIAQSAGYNSYARAVAASRLGINRAVLLERLARGKDPVVAAGAMSALRRVNPTIASAIDKDRMTSEAVEREKRKRYLAERERRDRAEAETERLNDRNRLKLELAPEFANIDVQERIRNCRAWANLEKNGISVTRRKVSFAGRVTLVETHWFSSDELGISVDVSGDAFSVTARIWTLENVKVGDRVRIEGEFAEGNETSVTLKNAEFFRL